MPVGCVVGFVLWPERLHRICLAQYWILNFGMPSQLAKGMDGPDHAHKCVPCIIATLPSIIRLRSDDTDVTNQVHGLSRVYCNDMALNVAGVRATLLRHGINEEYCDVPPNTCKALGLANVRADFLYDALRVLDPCQAMQREFWAQLSGGVSNVGHLHYFHCNETLLLRKPLDMKRLGRIGKGTRTFFSCLSDLHAEELFEAVEGQCVGGLPEWLVGLGTLPFLVIKLPSPFACLVLHGATASFSVCELSTRTRPELLGQGIGWSLGRHARRHGGFHRAHWLKQLLDSFPNARWRSVNDEEDSEEDNQPGHSLLSKTFMQDLADTTRGALCAVTGQHDNTPAWLQRLHKRLAALESTSDQLSAFRERKNLTRGQGFTAIALIHAFLVAQCLKKDCDLHKICCRALEMTMPPEIAAEVNAWMESEAAISVPSPAVVSRLRGRMDVAFMLIFRERLSEMVQLGGVSVFAAIDSSPQAGRDYEMLVLHIVRKNALAESHADIMALEDRVSWTLEARCEQWEQEVALMGRIRDRILVHVAPPVFLGAGRTALPMKLRVVVHAMMLLSKDTSDMRCLCKSYNVVHIANSIPVAKPQSVLVGPVCSACAWSNSNPRFRQ